MIKMADYEDKKGKVNWQAYRKAQIDAGEKCYRCGTYTLFGEKYRHLCQDCKALDDNPNEIRHSSYIRCPHCGHYENIWDMEYYDYLTEGIHEYNCENCEKEYDFQTYIEFTFESQKRAGESVG